MARSPRRWLDGTVVTVNLTDESREHLAVDGFDPAAPQRVGVRHGLRHVWTAPPPRAARSTPVTSLPASSTSAARPAVRPARRPPSGTTSSRLAVPVTGTAGAGITIGPGQAKNVPLLDLEKTDDYGAESHSGANKFTGKSGSRHLGRLDPRRERLRRLRAGPLLRQGYRQHRQRQQHRHPVGTALQHRLIGDASMR